MSRASSIPWIKVSLCTSEHATSSSLAWPCLRGSGPIALLDRLGTITGVLNSISPPSRRTLRLRASTDTLGTEHDGAIAAGLAAAAGLVRGLAAVRVREVDAQLEAEASNVALSELDERRADGDSAVGVKVERALHE